MIDIYWVMKYFIICGVSICVGYALFEVGRHFVEEKYSYYGHRIFKMQLSYQRAYFNIGIYLLGWAILVSASAMLIHSSWDLFILLLLLVFPSLFLGGRKAIQGMVQKERNWWIEWAKNKKSLENK